VLIDEVKEAAASNEILILVFDYVLDRLEEVDRDLVRFVELRVFGGLTIEEVVCVLKVSTSTVERDWWIAKVWFKCEFGFELWL